MLEAIFDMLSYPFMLRALGVGILVSLCAALLGVSLVQGRFKPVILTRLLNSLSFPEYITVKEKPWKRRLK